MSWRHLSISGNRVYWVKFEDRIKKNLIVTKGTPFILLANIPCRGHNKAPREPQMLLFQYDPTPTHTHAVTKRVKCFLSPCMPWQSISMIFHSNVTFTFKCPSQQYVYNMLSLLRVFTLYICGKLCCTLQYTAFHII